MGFYRGTNIVTNGLIFGYDADDRCNRFYKGEPTENLYYSTDVTKLFIQSLVFPIKPPVNPINGGYWNSLQWDGDINLLSVKSGETITISGYYMVYSTDISIPISGNGIQSWSSRGYENYSETPTEWNKWYYFTCTRYFDTDATNYRIEDRGYDYYHTGTTSLTSMYWCNIQVEKKEHPTQFVENNRTSTNSLIDLTGQNLINISNMSFDPTAHPIFNGTSNSIVIPGIERLTNYYTLSA